jgi:hypothetical protein
MMRNIQQPTAVPELQAMLKRVTESNRKARLVKEQNVATIRTATTNPAS